MWDFLCGQMTMSANKSRCDKEQKCGMIFLLTLRKWMENQPVHHGAPICLLCSWCQNLGMLEVADGCTVLSFSASGNHIAWVSHGSTVSFADASENDISILFLLVLIFILY